MKWLLVLAIVLPFAQQPTKVPKDKGAAKTNRSVDAEHTNPTQKNRQPSIKAVPISTESLIPAEDKETSISTTNATSKNSTQTPGEDLRIQRELVWFTGALVAVGILQAIVMFLTWWIYRRQAHEMRRQRHEMRRQRHVMLRQWKAMGEQAGLMTGQLEEMKKSGKQTDDQIAALLQAAQAAEKSAIAAEKTAMGIELSAAAAKASADTLVNSERAWVLVEIGELPDFQPNPGMLEILWIRPTVRNYGNTIARIKKIRAVVRLVPDGDTLPLQPEYPIGQGVDIQGINLIVPPATTAQPIKLGVNGDEFTQVRQSKTFLYLHGFIEYLDLSNSQRRTAFCFYYAIRGGYSPDPTRFYLELTAPPGYNDYT